MKRVSRETVLKRAERELDAIDTEVATPPFGYMPVGDFTRNPVSDLDDDDLEQLARTRGWLTSDEELERSVG